MLKDIKIGSHLIGNNHPVFITAETGITCNYDMNISKELIDVVSESGANAIKFIFWFPEEIMSDKKVIYKYQTIHGEKSENMFDMLSKLTFTLDQWYELKEYADKKNVILFSTIISPSGIEYAKKLNLDAFKIGSWEFNNISLWEQLSKFKKPIIVDTGPATTEEIMNVVKIAKIQNECPMILVHCYHTNNYEEINMKSIPYLKKRFQTHVGFSAKDFNIEMDYMAVALDIVFLEKRLTLNRNLPGHHHILSMEPNEFKNYVKTIRNLQKAIGKEAVIPSRNDLKERKKWFRSLVLNKNIKKGTKITKEMLSNKRPGTGISPENINYFIGKKIKRNLKTNELIKIEDVY